MVHLNLPSTNTKKVRKSAKSSVARAKGAKKRSSFVGSTIIKQDQFQEAGAKQTRNSAQTKSSRKPSRRKLKAQRPSPSHELIAALEATAQFQAVPPKFKGKADLSYTAPWNLGLQQKPKLPSPSPPSVRHLTQSAWPDQLLSLQIILADYIRHVWPIVRFCEQNSLDESLQAHLDHALLNVYNKKSLKFLESKGYGPEEVVKWAWILTAPNTERAAWRLMTIANPRFNRDGPKDKPVPSFLLLFLLRQAKINNRTLKILLSHAWDRLLGRRRQYWSKGCSATWTEGFSKPDPGTSRRWKSSNAQTEMIKQMDETTMMTMVVRLLRHARQVWPASLPSITSILSIHGNKVDSLGATTGMSLKPSAASRLTFWYNRALTLLSVPSCQSPFLSLPYHQRAQFNLLKSMACFHPPLTINREGYRAVARVQLAHKKTLRERAWAAMKAKSWPPWKEDKVGMDKERGLKDGISRACESMLRLKEAGYAHDDWERAANILAGWDTDRSPTIQTRSLIRRASNYQELPLDPPKNSLGHEKSPDIWAARIRATRTLEEAWAAFLSFKDQKLAPSSEVYFAVFEKLIYDKLRKSEDNAKETTGLSVEIHDETDRILPGDSKNVYAAPISPNEAVYNRSPPLSLDQLFKQMIREGCTPSPRCLSFLIRHASSLGVGCLYLRYSGLPPSVLECLYQSPETFLASTSERLRAIPEEVFSALISLFTRFALSCPLDIGHQRALVEGRPCSTNQSQPVNPLLHAFALVTSRGSSYQPCWYSLLCALARDGAVVSSVEYSSWPAWHDVLSWKIMRQTLAKMERFGIEMDGKAFRIVCVGLEKALVGGYELHYNAHQHAEGKDHHEVSCQLGEALAILEDSSHFIQKMFQRLVGSTLELALNDVTPLHPAEWDPDNEQGIDSSTLLPSLLEVPGPVLLHSYVRVLGLLQDYDGLLSLVRWMRQYSDELDAVASESSNGKRVFRRTLVAIRVFVEQSWKQGQIHETQGEIPEPSKTTFQQSKGMIREQVEQVHNWGGWPSDAEVEKYVASGRFPG